MFVGFGADNYIVYTVKSGDTLDRIAKRYGTTYQAIAQANMIDDPSKIEVGQELMIYPASAPKTVPQYVPTNTTKMSSTAIVNYALAGGILALSIPIVVGMARKRKEARR